MPETRSASSSSPHEPDPPVPAAPPRRAPISAAIDTRAVPPAHAGAAARVVQLMDVAHDDGGQRPAKVVAQRSEVMTATYYPVTREVRLPADSDLPHYEAAHEFAHWIDHGDSGDVNFRLSASPAWKAWRDAVSASPRVRALVAARDTSPQPSLHTERLLWKELWARAYVQWLARKTGDPALTREIEQMRNSEDVDTQLLQWTDEEFGPIATHIEAVFTMRGWLP